MTTMMTLNIMMTVLFITMKHPLSMGASLLIQTILVSMITGNLYQNFWFSYILFLVMIGGMLILFMYMTSIASNEKFKTNMSMVMLMPLMITTFTMIYSMNMNETYTNTAVEMNNLPQFETMLSKFTNAPMMILFMFLMMYLLLAMIASVKITSFKQGSIRQMN